MTIFAIFRWLWSKFKSPIRDGGVTFYSMRNWQSSARILMRQCCWLSSNPTLTRTSIETQFSGRPFLDWLSHFHCLTDRPSLPHYTTPERGFWTCPRKVDRNLPVSRRQFMIDKLRVIFEHINSREMILATSWQVTRHPWTLNELFATMLNRIQVIDLFKWYSLHVIGSYQWQQKPAQQGW